MRRQLSARPLLREGRIGDVVGDNWVIDELLGAGGTASVYGARHRNGHRVALKVLAPPLSVDPRLVARFRREGYVSNKVPHEGAVRVLDDATTSDGCPVLVLERLDGHTLDAHVGGSSPPLTMRRAVEVMIALLEIVGAAHSVGIVHRDIKPANVFETTKGRIKLLDFGIALVVAPEHDARATATGAVIGTPAYMAPEQARGHREVVGPRTDLWAVAATGLTLMTGGSLRRAATVVVEIAMAALQPMPPAVSFGAALGGPLGAVLDRALAYDPEDRYANADEMRQALLGLVSSTPSELLSVAPPPGTARMRVVHPVAPPTVAKELGELTTVRDRTKSDPVLPPAPASSPPSSSSSLPPPPQKFGMLFALLLVTLAIAAWMFALSSRLMEQ